MTLFCGDFLRNRHSVSGGVSCMMFRWMFAVSGKWRAAVMHKTVWRSVREPGRYGMTDDLAPTENFYLTPEGITFHYNVYEIAPYVMGAIQISLPYQIMEHLLSADSSILSEIRTNY